jgi:hypothetical protein
MCESGLTGAVGVHDIDLAVPIPVGDEGNLVMREALHQWQLAPRSHRLRGGCTECACGKQWQDGQDAYAQQPHPGATSLAMQAEMDTFHDHIWPCGAEWRPTRRTADRQG